MSKSTLFVCAALLAAFPVLSIAGPAIGGSVGSARVNEDDFEGDDTSWKVFAATSHAHPLGGELGFIDFGRLGGNGPGAQSWNLAATLGIPLDWLTPYGKAGISFAEVEGSSLREEWRDEELYYGVGLRFGPHASPLGMRIEYERFTLEQEDLDLLSAGLEFRF